MQIYLEAYTSVLVNAATISPLLESMTTYSDSSNRLVSKELYQILENYVLKLQILFNKHVKIADRDMLELRVEQCIVEPSLEKDIALLIVGDPLSATTHTDLILRAIHRKIPFKVVHNASIVNAIGSTGLQLYRFGQIVSIVFFSETWRPDSFYDKIKENRQLGLHTLCLLDIQLAERTTEGLIKNLPKYVPPRFLLIPQAIEELLEVEQARKQGVYTSDTWIVGVARLGSDSQKIVAGRMEDLQKVDWGSPLHSLVIPGDVHPLEQEYLNVYSYKS